LTLIRSCYYVYESDQSVPTNTMISLPEFYYSPMYNFLWVSSSLVIHALALNAKKGFTVPVCSVVLQKNDAMSRRRFKYLSLLGHIDGMVLDMHHIASVVNLSTYSKHFKRKRSLQCWFCIKKNNWSAACHPKMFTSFLEYFL